MNDFLFFVGLIIAVIACYKVSNLFYSLSATAQRKGHKVLRVLLFIIASFFIVLFAICFLIVALVFLTILLYLFADYVATGGIFI